MTEKNKKFQVENENNFKGMDFSPFGHSYLVHDGDDPDENLNYPEFCERVALMVADHMGPDYDVKQQQVTKNNSITLEAISIVKHSVNVSPTIYLEDFYNEYTTGVSLEAIADNISEVYHHCMCGIRDNTTCDFSFECMRDKIVLRLVNYDLNKEMLADMPYYRYKDLAVTFACLVRLDLQGLGTVRINNAMMNEWKQTPEDLKAYAMKNSSRLLPWHYSNIFSVLAQLMLRDADRHPNIGIDRKELGDVIEHLSDDDGKMGKTMYVLTNESGVYGASCLLYEGVLEKIHNDLGCGFYIIPSSVNEVLIIPDQVEEMMENLREMVREVNTSQVPPQEILSYEVYHYPETDFKF